jgi:hypothetical protein
MAEFCGRGCTRPERPAELGRPIVDGGAFPVGVSGDRGDRGDRGGDRGEFGGLAATFR